MVLLPLCSPGLPLEDLALFLGSFRPLPLWLAPLLAWTAEVHGVVRGPCGSSSLHAPIQHSTEGLQAGFSVQVSGPWASLMPTVVALPSHGRKALLKTVVIADQPAGRSFHILIHFLFF